MRSLSFTARQKWCAEFADEIFKVNKTPRHIFFEEAQNFLPQVLKFDEQKAVLYAMSRIIEEGRSSGLGFTIISQRPAKINKDALTQIDNLIVLGMMGPQDLDQVEEWFKHHFENKEALRAMIDTLPHLKPGQAWALMPEHLTEPIQFEARLRVTYHAGRTPKHGEKPVNVSKFSVGEAVEKLKKIFAGKQTERRQEVQDLAEAKKRIRELEGQLRKSAHNAAQVSKAPVKVADERAIARAVMDATKSYRDLLNRDVQAFREIARSVKELPSLGNRILLIADRQMNPSAPKVSGGEIQRKETPYPEPRRERDPDPGAKTQRHTNPRPMQLKAGARKMLTILAQWHPEPKTRDELGALAGFAASGGTFGDYLSKLRMAGFIQENGRGISITDEGLSAVGDIPPRPDSTEELVGMWKSKFKGGVGRMLEVLVEAHPSWISRELLGDRSGFSRPAAELSGITCHSCAAPG